jgi:hypothetical protein
VQDLLDLFSIGNIINQKYTTAFVRSLDLLAWQTITSNKRVVIIWRSSVGWELFGSKDTKLKAVFELVF